MKTVLRSQELTCPSCVAKIEGALRRLDGVQRAKVHFTTGRIEVEHDAEAVAPDALARVVTGVGYAANVAPF